MRKIETYIDKMKNLEKMGFNEIEMDMVLSRKNTTEEINNFREKYEELEDSFEDMLQQGSYDEYDEYGGIELDFGEAIKLMEVARSLTEKEFKYLKDMNKY